MFLSVHSALTNENVLRKSNVILVQGGIRFNFVEYNRKSQTINRCGFTERYSEILSQSF